MIFEAWERTNWDSLQYGETAYSFLDRCAWPMCRFARDFINHWSALLPADEEFISKIRSKSDKQHEAAIFELLVFAVFRQYRLQINKNPVSNTSKTPDFSILVDDRVPIQLECTLSANALESINERQKKSAVLQTIEEMNYFPFFVSVYFNTLSNNSLPKKKFKEFLFELGRINERTLPANGDPPEYKYIDCGWELTISLIRKNGNVRRSIGIISQPAKIVDNFKSLYLSLNGKKPSRYEITSTPYVICMAIDDITADEFEFSSVLFGPNDLKKIYYTDVSKSFFLQQGKPINKTVSAVIFCKYLKLFGLHTANVSCWHNPFAINPLPTGLLPFDENAFMVKDQILERKKHTGNKSVLDLLSIDKGKYEDWLKFENKKAPSDTD